MERKSNNLTPAARRVLAGSQGYDALETVHEQAMVRDAWSRAFTKRLAHLDFTAELEATGWYAEADAAGRLVVHGIFGAPVKEGDP